MSSELLRNEEYVEYALTFSAVQVAKPREVNDIKVQVTLSHEAKLLEKGEPASLARK